MSQSKSESLDEGLDQLLQTQQWMNKLVHLDAMPLRLVLSSFCLPFEHQQLLHHELEKTLEAFLMKHTDAKKYVETFTKDEHIKRLNKQMVLSSVYSLRDISNYYHIGCLLTNPEESFPFVYDPDRGVELLQQSLKQARYDKAGWRLVEYFITTKEHDKVLQTAQWMITNIRESTFSSFSMALALGSGPTKNVDKANTFLKSQMENKDIQAWLIHSVINDTPLPKEYISRVDLYHYQTTDEFIYRQWYPACLTWVTNKKIEQPDVYFSQLKKHRIESMTKCWKTTDSMVLKDLKLTEFDVEALVQNIVLGNVDRKE